MEVRQLRYFLAVAEERSFTRAAARLHLSQQSLSAAIKHLEGQLGCALFLRTSQRVELTAAGTALLDAGPPALVAMRAAEEAARSAGTDTPRPVRLRYGLDCEHLVLPWLRARPGPVRAWSGTDADNLRALRAGEADGLFGWLLDAQPGLEVRYVAEEAALLLLPTGHPLAALDSAPVAAIRREPLVLFPRGAAPAIWDALRAALGGSEIVELPVPGPAAVLEAVLDGAGVAPVTAGLAATFADPGVKVIPIDPPPRFALHLAWLSGAAPPVV